MNDMLVNIRTRHGKWRLVMTEEDAGKLREDLLNERPLLEVRGRHYCVAAQDEKLVIEVEKGGIKTAVLRAENIIGVVFMDANDPPSRL